MVKDLRNTLKKFNIPDGVECGGGSEIDYKKIQLEKKPTVKKPKSRGKK